MSDTAPTDTDAADDGSAAPGRLEAEVAVLREENQLLREEYQRRLQAGYRRTALGFGGLAVLAAGGGVLLPNIRELLLVIAAIAAFAGLLTYYLTPERFVAATVGESVYSAVAHTGDSLIEELGLQDRQLYIPLERGVRVFIPQHRNYTIPSADDIDGVLVVPEDETARGVALTPTGADLIEEFERAATGELTAERAPEQLAEALVEQFELVDTATVDSRDQGRVTIGVAESAYEDVSRFDHPVSSILATGLATILDTPIELETARAEDARVDYLITCRWQAPDTAETADATAGGGSP